MSTCHGLPSLSVHDALYSMKCPPPLTTCPHHQSGHRWEGQQLPLGTFALEEFPRKRSSESRWWSSFSEHHVPSSRDPLLTSGKKSFLLPILPLPKTPECYPRWTWSPQHVSYASDPCHAVPQMVHICDSPGPCSPRRLQAPQSRDCILCQSFQTQSPGDPAKSQILIQKVKGGPESLHF